MTVDNGRKRIVRVPPSDCNGLRAYARLRECRNHRTGAPKCPKARLKPRPKGSHRQLIQLTLMLLAHFLFGIVCMNYAYAELIGGGLAWS